MLRGKEKKPEEPEKKEASMRSKAYEAVTQAKWNKQKCIMNENAKIKMQVRQNPKRVRIDCKIYKEHADQIINDLEEELRVELHKLRPKKKTNVPNILTSSTNIVSPSTNVVTPISNVVSPSTNIVSHSTKVVSPSTNIVTSSSSKKSRRRHLQVPQLQLHDLHDLQLPDLPLSDASENKSRKRIVLGGRKKTVRKR